MPPAITLIGQRARHLREQRGWSRRELAERSGLSQRMLAEIEAGSGNPTLQSLIALADTLGASLTALIAGGSAHRDDADALACLPPDQQRRALRAVAPPEKIALVGLRGAGKSTVGARIARALGCPFAEIDAAVEEEAGLRLSALFEIHGTERYRALERRCVARLLARPGPLVLAAGGSVVTSPDAWALLREGARTLWLRAPPEIHLARVLSQGDQRPVQGRADALAELRAILDHRAPLYAQAEFTLDTDGSPEAVAARALALLSPV